MFDKYICYEKKHKEKRTLIKSVESRHLRKCDMCDIDQVACD